MSNPRNRNLLIIIGVLLLTNIAVLAYFLAQEKPGKHRTAPIKSERNGIGDMLQKEVGFTEEQLAKYKVLKDQQREKIKPMYDDMRKAKDSLFRLLSYPGPTDSLASQVTDAIAQKQKTLDLQTFNYFKKLRELCRPEQESKYDSVIIRTFRRMGGKSSRQGESEKK